MNKPHLGFKRVTTANALETDPVVSDMWTVNHSTGEARPQEPGDWISLITSIELRPVVPSEVHRMFTLVQGALCYAHWYYPMVTIGMNEMLRIADVATDKACKQRRLPYGEDAPFARRIDSLATVGAIDDADKQLWHRLRKQRNRATHPSSQNIYGFAQAFDTARHVRDLIDRINWFEPELRRATEDDREFVESTYFATQRPIIEHLFGWRSDDVERQKFAEFYDMANTQIAIVDGVEVGWLTVQSFPSHISLQSIFLTEEWLDRGIGSGLIGDVIAEATSNGLPVRLSTAKNNRAQNLYANLGFRKLYEDENKAYFEYRLGDQEQHVRLRPVTHNDFKRLHAWFSDPAFVIWWGGVPKSAEEVAKKYLGDRVGIRSYIVVHDGEDAGYIQSWNVSAEEAGIDIVLTPEKQGYGIGGVAVRMLAEQLQDDGYATVIIDPAEQNIVAVRAFQKAGFKHDGTTAEGKLRMVFVR